MKKQEKIEIIADILNKKYPNKKTELYYKNDYQLLIAVMLSAQSTDKQVNKVNKIFFQKINKPEDVLNLWVEQIKKHINSVWFFNTKAKNIYKTSKIITEEYDSKIPKKLEELIKLPWVGIKTAKVVTAILYDAPYLPVDTHIHRVLNRIGIVSTKTPLQTDLKMSKLLKDKASIKLHHSLIFFWRYHCTARKPKCNICPLTKICKYYKEIKN